MYKWKWTDFLYTTQIVYQVYFLLLSLFLKKACLWTLSWSYFVTAQSGRLLLKCYHSCQAEPLISARTLLFQLQIALPSSGVWTPQFNLPCSNSQVGESELDTHSTEKSITGLATVRLHFLFQFQFSTEGLNKIHLTEVRVNSLSSVKDLICPDLKVPYVYCAVLHR